MNACWPMGQLGTFACSYSLSKVCVVCCTGTGCCMSSLMDRPSDTLHTCYCCSVGNIKRGRKK